MTNHSYFVVMVDFGRKGLQAVVSPEHTRADIVAMIKSGEYADIAFIHHVDGLLVEDVTAELIDAAELELKVEHRDPHYSQRMNRLAGVA